MKKSASGALGDGALFQADIVGDEGDEPMRILKRGAVLLVAGALVAHGIFLSMISSETLGICADRSGNLYHAVRFSFGWSQ